MQLFTQSQLVTFASGLKCVCAHCPADEVEMAGVLIGVGSRDEDDSQAGLAHFIEHTIFKGTVSRSSKAIIERMESIGGELNAYTTKETTVLYSIFPRGYAARAIELLADLIINSLFPLAELTKEREVVADEIDSYLDVPADAIVDEFEDMFFADSSLGHNILGTPETLRTFSPEMCREFIIKHYTTSNSTFFYSGTMIPTKVERLVEKYFASMPQGRLDRKRVPPVAVTPFNVTKKIEIHQSHTIIGARSCDMFSERRFATGLMVNMLGGPGMSSLLNMQLRERLGLVYSVDATASMFTDTGMVTVYYGCDSDDTLRCHRLTVNAIESMASRELTPRRLARAKSQYLGQTVVASANFENRVLAMARTAHFRSKVLLREEVVSNIAAVTSREICEVAGALIDSGICTLTFQ